MAVVCHHAFVATNCSLHAISRLAPLSVVRSVKKSQQSSSENFNLAEKSLPNLIYLFTYGTVSLSGVDPISTAKNVRHLLPRRLFWIFSAVTGTRSETLVQFYGRMRMSQRSKQQPRCDLPSFPLFLACEAVVEAADHPIIKRHRQQEKANQSTDNR